MKITSRYRRPSSRVSRGLSSGIFVSWLLLSLLPAGCEDQHRGLLDPDGSPPFIRTFRILPDSVSLNSLIPSNGSYAITLACQAEVSDPDGASTIGQVTADVIPPGGSDPLLSTTLSTDSSSGVVRYYSGQIHFQVIKSEVGAYHVVLRATDQLALTGNMIDRTLMILRTNSPPVLSNLAAPDTVALPVGGTIDIHMSVTVSDSNGLADVREVFFRSLDSSDPTAKFFLYDNGNPANGDQTADDGVYSIIVRLNDSPTVRRTFRFAFQATDSFADTSATLLHYLTVR